MAEKKNNAPKKGGSVKKLLLLLLLLFLIIVVGAAAFAHHQLSKINQLEVGEYENPSTVIDSDEVASGSDTISEEELNWGDAGVATQVKGVCNILLIGQDTRVEGQRGRSDSMILLSINKNTQQMTMVSLMRDMYVQIPGYNSNRINAAFAYGGAALLDETIEYNFGVKIDYNVEVDFNGFKDVIDTIGGVDIDLYQAEVDYLNKANGWNLTVGVNHLTGEQALAYARIRYVGFYDFERTQRQRAVLTAVFESLKGQSLPSLLAIYDSIADNLYTDMNSLQILSIATSAYGMIGNGLHSYRIPTDDMYKNEIIKGQEVLVIPDWNAARSQLYDYLYSDNAE